METKYTKEELIQFEDDIVQMYREGKIKAPLHLSGGNESELIELFKEINPQDFIFTTYRSHYHALLKGMPRERLINWILDLKSIHVMDKEYKIFSSAIVGGTLSIALGYALSIKIKNDSNFIEYECPNHNGDTHYECKICGYKGVNGHKCNSHFDKTQVWCFIGDMTASTGVFHDTLKYAMNFNLPITFVIENNGLSTDTKTHEAWGTTEESIKERYDILAQQYPKFIKHYKYTRTRPHYGIGSFVIFPDENAKDSGKSF